MTGAAVQWLRDQLGLIATAEESEAVASSVPDTGGVYLVPAFTGLGAPYWDPSARGTIVGLTRGSSRAHLVRATLESIAYQTRDVLRCFEQDAGVAAEGLQVDGGATANDFLMQFQADVLGVPLHRPAVLETTALKAASKRRGDIGSTQAHQFLIQIDVFAALGGQCLCNRDGFNKSDYGDQYRRSHQVSHQLRRKIRHFETRQPPRHST